MAVELTAGEFKARFPEFEEVPDSRVTAIIDEAKRYVTVTWLEADQVIALRLLTAHFIATEDPLNDGERAMRPGALTSDKLGNASQTWATTSAAVDAAGNPISPSQFSTTVYGLRFLDIQRSNFRGPVLV